MTTMAMMLHKKNRKLVMFLHAQQYKKFSSLNVITTRFCNNNNNHVGFLHATIISTTLHKSKKNCASFLHRIIGITFHKSKNKLMYFFATTSAILCRTIVGSL
jgi:hypothetical protein